LTLDVEFVERDFDHFSFFSVERVFAEFVIAVIFGVARAGDTSGAVLNPIAAFRIDTVALFDSQLEAAEDDGRVGLESDGSAATSDFERSCKVANVERSASPVSASGVVKSAFYWSSSFSSRAGRA
jgi:hypothetical protein